MAFGNDVPYVSTTEEIPSSCWTKTKKIFAPLYTLSFLKVFLGGQVLSLLICGTGVTSQILNDTHGINAPTTQSFANYLLLALVYCTLLCLRKSREKNFYHIFTKRWWKYILVALVDVEANYLVVKAYQYTTLTSVQLLDCITIPVVILLSFLILRTRYRIIHIVGVVTCIAGLGALIGADVLSGRASSGDSAPSNKLLGDIFCLLGASLYGVSNVAQEYVVRQYTRTEFLGMVGLFGTFVSGIQLVALERQELASFSWNIEAILLLLGFAACMFCLYSFFPVVIQWSSATVVNLSILTADMYTLIIGIFVFHFAFSGLYLFGFGLIFAGVILYSLRPTKDSPAGPRSYSLFHNNQSSENITHIRVQDDDDDAAAGTTTILTDGVDIEGATPRDDDTEQLHKEFSKSLNGDSN
ncbi:solute carrier family 35 member F2-like [Strongylocentrotus purpuratus]|uniref:Solute carrier family 35 member F2 n=1 Tax=Strongylocentrotus purpuratus TaxID=7668 RepID=A0A7M7PIS6_STRPU|nr:solute carrier family 35 member F2-like [Strongylocentrotus purpuratus]